MANDPKYADPFDPAKFAEMFAQGVADEDEETRKLPRVHKQFLEDKPFDLDDEPGD